MCLGHWLPFIYETFAVPRPTSEARVPHACVNRVSLFLVPIREAVGRKRMVHREDLDSGAWPLARSRGAGRVGAPLGL